MTALVFKYLQHLIRKEIILIKFQHRIWRRTKMKILARNEYVATYIFVRFYWLNARTLEACYGERISRETLSIGPKPNYTSELFRVGRAKGSGRFFFRELRRFHVGFRRFCRRYNTRDRDIVYVQPPRFATGENRAHAVRETPRMAMTRYFHYVAAARPPSPPLSSFALQFITFFFNGTVTLKDLKIFKIFNIWRRHFSGLAGKV